MAEEFVFHDLLAAIKDSVIQANSAAQQSSLESILTWFEKDGSPKMTEILLPSMRPDAPVESIKIPLITLIPLSSTKIDRMTVEFNVQFADLITKSDDSPFKQSSLGAAVEPSNQKDLTSNFARRGKDSEPNLARIQIEIKGTEPPEALMRINDHLLKYLP
ncbi:DUF2589 domain-containing protein [Tumebacillus flagellatus]|uniref:DUF2589 domain-containing protein n=1 Tax=Tumebacillus flagellatus TaxID=1157490 RepID=A0A074LLT1_9BACL|nr:DUF2589 domain-containing protein [Tumebacillus flagellatus]KEO80843.1 hypothetical protein EL26_24120 [Tumebacillus flagellatus]